MASLNSILQQKKHVQNLINPESKSSVHVLLRILRIGPETEIRMILKYNFVRGLSIDERIEDTEKFWPMIVLIKQPCFTSSFDAEIFIMATCRVQAIRPMCVLNAVLIAENRRIIDKLRKYWRLMHQVFIKFYTVKSTEGLYILGSSFAQRSKWHIESLGEKKPTKTEFSGI